MQVVREASRRVLGLRPFDVQLIGGMILHTGQIAEMRTGEGKTLVAVLPAYLNALSGKGVQASAASPLRDTRASCQRRRSLRLRGPWAPEHLAAQSAQMPPRSLQKSSWRFSRLLVAHNSSCHFYRLRAVQCKGHRMGGSSPVNNHPEHR